MEIPASNGVFIGQIIPSKTFVVRHQLLPTVKQTLTQYSKYADYAKIFFDSYKSSSMIYANQTEAELDMYSMWGESTLFLPLGAEGKRTPYNISHYFS